MAQVARLYMFARTLLSIHCDYRSCLLTDQSTAQVHGVVPAGTQCVVVGARCTKSKHTECVGGNLALRLPVWGLCPDLHCIMVSSNVFSYGIVECVIRVECCTLLCVVWWVAVSARSLAMTKQQVEGGFSLCTVQGIILPQHP